MLLIFYSNQAFTKTHSPSYQQSYLPSFFFYSPLPTTLTSTTYLSSPKLILFFLIFLIPTLEGRPSISLLGQNPSFFVHPPFLLLPYSRPLTPILCTFSSVCPWVDQYHMETFLEQPPPPPISDASTSILTMLFGWVYLESSPPHDVAIPFHITLPLHDMSNPPNNPNFTTSSSFFIPSHFLTHYLSIWKWKGGQQ